MKNKFYSKTCIGLDIETTDLDPQKGEIIELAAVKFRAGKIIKKFQSLVKPQGKIPRVVQGITGITDQDVSEAPSLGQVKEEFTKFVGDHPIVGHNISFDINFLNSKGFNFKNKRYDTWKLATILIPNLPSHSLEALTDFFNIKHLESHRALDDVLASIELFKLLVGKIYQIDQELLQDIVKSIKKQNWKLEDIFKEVSRKSRKKPKKRKTGLRTEKNNKKQNQNIKNIAAFFQDKEKIKRKYKEYQYKPAQIELLKKILKNLKDQSDSLCFIEPGVGKELAYLAASIYFAKNSAANVFIAFEDFKKIQEIESNSFKIINKILPFDFSKAILLPQSRYLCRRRFDHFKKQAEFSQTELNALIKILLWEPTTDTGILSELAGLFEEEEVFNRINCNKNYCLKDRCPSFYDCFYYKSLEKAQKSDIVLGDHAAYIEYYIESDKNISKSIIIDRSYLLEESFQKYYYYELSDKVISNKFKHFQAELAGLNKSLIKSKKKKKVEEKIQMLSREVASTQDKAILYFGILGIFLNKQDFAYGFKQLVVNDAISEHKGWEEVAQVSRNLIINLNKLVLEANKLIKYIQVKKYQNFSSELGGISKDIYKYITTIQLLTTEESIKTTFWLEEGYQGIKLIMQPPEIEYEKINKALQSNHSHNFIISSVTDQKAMRSVEDKLKISDQVKNIFVEKGNKSSNLLKILLPVDIPNPNSAEFGEIVSNTIMDIAKRLKNGVVVTAPSRSIVENIYKNISIGLKKEGIEVNAQGVSGSRDKVYQKFLSSSKSLLVVNHQMLYKKDIAPDKIKCLIMVKLPFDVSFMPENSSKSDSFNNFREKTLPQSVFKYLKIFQKLSKNRSKKGVFVNLDNRVQTANYGDDFIGSLPDINVDYHKVENIAKEATKWLK